MPVPSAFDSASFAHQKRIVALGTGIRYSPKDLVVESFQAETGEMALSLRGQWLENFKMFTGRSIRVSSAVVKGHVLASCFIPESLFG